MTLLCAPYTYSAHREAIDRLRHMNEMLPKEDATDALLGLAVKSVYRAAGTVYECGISSCTKLSGIQRKKQLATVSNMWNTLVSGVSSEPPPVDTYVHSALLDIARSGHPAGSGSKS